MDDEVIKYYRRLGVTPPWTVPPQPTPIPVTNPGNFVAGMAGREMVKPEESIWQKLGNYLNPVESAEAVPSKKKK